MNLKIFLPLGKSVSAKTELEQENVKFVEEVFLDDKVGINRTSNCCFGEPFRLEFFAC